MHRAALLLFLGLAATACTKRDEALDAVGHAQVLDIHGDQPAAAFTYHLERKGVRWVSNATLERPLNHPLLTGGADAKVDRSIEGVAIDGFLRAAATTRRGTPKTRPKESLGTVTIKVLGPAGAAPVVLERVNGAKWSVDGAELADPVRIDDAYRAMMRELGLYDAVKWQESGPTY